MTADSCAVAISNVHKAFLEGDITRNVLINADAEFKAGSIHVITGRSGSGKSTLLNLICGIDIPDKGTIMVANTPVSSLQRTERTLLRRRHIGIIFQFFNLIPSLTVAENVLLPLELNNLPNRKARVDAMLERVGLGSRHGSYPSSLSGGEQQRVAIARALVHQPILILADEPTGNLDDQTAQGVMETLREASRESTVIMVTHSKEIAQSSDCRWHLQSGQLTSQ